MESFGEIIKTENYIFQFIEFANQNHERNCYMENNKYLKWIMPSMKNRTVKSNCLDEGFNFRIEKAKEQYQLGKKKGIPKNKESHKKEIVTYVNEFLSSIMGMKEIDDPYVYPKKTKTRRIDYWKICSENNLENKQDIVWIKFTTDGIISVIGTSCDIFFNDNAKNSTVSGCINQKLELKWDESVVLIFPLKNIPKGLNRSDIESGIGNYLISKGVPILDFYSHNY